MEDKMEIIIQSEGKPYLTDPMETLPQVLLPKSSLLRFTRFFVTPEIVACQAPLSMRILQARKLEWVAISSSRDLLNQGSNPCLLHCRQILYH